jgi:phospholipid/cholesterol/gamma-HCH transport system substrate-binding protein
MSRAPLLVGLLLLGSAAALTWFVMATSKDQFDDASTYPLRAHFLDAAGVRWKTRVQVNGIDVGKISKIGHVQTAGGLVAEVTLRVHRDYKVYANASLKKAAESLLGDFRLDLNPGSASDACSDACTGACVEGRCEVPCSAGCKETQACATEVCVYPVLPAEGLIGHVQSVSDLDAIQSELKHVAGNVRSVTESLSHVLAGPEGEGSLKTILARVEQSMGAIQAATLALSGTLARNDHRVDDIVIHLAEFTASLAAMTKPGGVITRSGRNIEALTARVDDITLELRSLLEGDTPDEASIRNTLEQLSSTAAHLTEIARKVNQGQGTVGRVVNDPAIAEKIEATLDDTSELIGGLSRLETQIELRTQYEVPFGTDEANVQGIKNVLALRLVPKPDKYYVLEAVADPRGRQRKTRIETKTGGEVTEEEISLTAFNDLKFSAMFAKRYYFLTLRFGILESTGGFGVNLHALDDNLTFRFDMFDFNRSFEGASIFPRLRTTFLYGITDHIALQGGFDDPLNESMRTWFLGGALSFTDDDLKTLLTVAPSP